jgi:hypothetical protein
MPGRPEVSLEIQKQTLGVCLWILDARQRRASGMTATFIAPRAATACRL